MQLSYRKSRRSNVMKKSLFSTTLTILILSISTPATAATIADARVLPSGSFVSLDDVVVTSTVDWIQNGNNAALTIQDASGGLTIFGTTAEISQLIAGGAIEGNQIDLSGTISSFNGLTQLYGDGVIGSFTPMQLNNVDGAPGVPDPVPVNVTDLLDLSATAESLESELVSLSDVSFVAGGGTFTGQTNYQITDGTNFATVRVSTTFNDLVGSTIPTTSVNLTGIFSQFDTSSPASGVTGVGYQILLLGTEGVTAIPEPANSMLLAVSAIVGHLSRRRRSLLPTE